MSAFEDLGEGVFDVLGLIRVTLPRCILWQWGEVGEPGAYGVQFVGALPPIAGASGGGADGVADITIVDVSADETEPSMAMAFPEDLLQFDRFHRSRVEMMSRRGEFSLIRWLSPIIDHLGGISVLTSSFLLMEDGRERMHVQVRLAAPDGRKLALCCGFDVAYSAQVEESLYFALREAKVGNIKLTWVRGLRTNKDHVSFAEGVRGFFGVDLPVIGGDGTRANPFKMKAHSEEEALALEIRVVHYSRRLRNVFWRWLSRDAWPEGPPGSDVVSLKQYRFFEDRVETEWVRIYFCPDRRPTDDTNRVSCIPWVYSDETGMTVPWKIGVFDFTEAFDNVPEQPGTDVSLVFDALHLTATIYLYRRQNTPARIDHETLWQEFELVSHVIEANRQPTYRYPDPPTDGRLFVRCWMLDPEATAVTCLWLTSIGGKFLKIRVTWPRAVEFDEFVREFSWNVLRAAGYGQTSH